MYGPTETTVWSTVRSHRDAGAPDHASAGRSRTRASTSSTRTASRCPIGVPGELYIGGDGVALGYLDRPELTAERFVPDPFAPRPARACTAPATSARWRADGTLEYLGRLDDQVKVRGYRIELGEIEAVLAEHADVREGRGLPVGSGLRGRADRRLLRSTAEGRFAPIGLRKHLRAKLPEYMIPQHFLPVTELPLTPNGKVDRARLPRPVVAEVSDQQYAAPSDPIEITIAEIWTQLIRPTRPIGQADKFFEMGGYSLLGMQALLQMEERIGVKLTFLTLFQENLADLAKRCRSELAKRNAAKDGNAS